MKRPKPIGQEKHSEARGIQARRYATGYMQRINRPLTADDLVNAWERGHWQARQEERKRKAAQP